MTTPLYVINLAVCTERRRRMEERLRPLQAEFDIRFFAAVDGRALSADALARDYDEARAIRTLDRPLTSGEVGCALSHKSVYKDLLTAGHRCAVILEDDVVLDADFPDVFRRVQSWLLCGCPRIALFTWAAKYVGWGRRLTPGRNVHPVWSAALASGYAVNAAAAAALDDYQTPIRNVADCWTDVLRDGVAEMRCVVPYNISAAAAGPADSSLAKDRDARWQGKAEWKTRQNPVNRTWRHLCRMRCRELAKPFLRIRRQPLRG